MMGRLRMRSTLVFRATPALAAALVAACTLGPDYRRPDVPLPTAFREPPAPASATPAPASAPATPATTTPLLMTPPPSPVSAASAMDVVNTPWWEAFGDPQLTALINEAIDANLDLQLAAFRIEQFDARLQISRAAQYPQVGYAGTANRQRYSEERPAPVQIVAQPNQNAFVIGLNVGWELDLWGRVRRANEAALADLLATEEARRAVMLTVVTDVATSYFELISLDRRLALARETLRNREDAAALLETRYVGGSSTKLAVAEARAAAAEVAAMIPNLERQIATLENGISTLVGRNAGPIDRRAADALAMPAVPQGVPSDVLARRPDVVAAEQTLVAANALIGVAKAEYFPTISLTGALGLGSNDLSRLLMHSATTYFIGADMLGTIFSAGRIEGDVRQTEAVQKQMVVKYRQAILTALREVDDALVFRAKAGEELVAVDRQVDALEEVVRLAKMRFEGGQSIYLEVLDAERQLYDAQAQEVQRRRDTFVSLISLYKAMGGGWMKEQEKLRAPEEPREAMAATRAEPRAAGAVQ